MTPREQFKIDGRLHLRCKECEQVKDVGMFYFNMERASYNPYCDPCNSDRSKKWQSKHKKYINSKKLIPIGSPELELFINMTLKELAL